MICRNWNRLYIQVCWKINRDARYYKRSTITLLGSDVSKRQPKDPCETQKRALDVGAGGGSSIRFRGSLKPVHQNRFACRQHEANWTAQRISPLLDSWMKRAQTGAPGTPLRLGSIFCKTILVRDYKCQNMGNYYNGPLSVSIDPTGELVAAITPSLAGPFVPGPLDKAKCATGPDRTLHRC